MMNKQVSDQTLASEVRKLPKDMQPQRDLWPGIERAIQHKNQRVQHTDKQQSLPPMAWAASIIAAVLVAWISFAPTSTNITPDLVSNHSEQAALNSDVLVKAMQTNFQQQKQAMLVSYGKPDMSNLPVTMQNQLEELAQARKTIEKALKADANNVDLLNLLRFTQQQELNLLQQLYPYMNNNNVHWQSI